MYVSITGLKPKGIIGWIKFWAYTIPASKDAQNAEGILHCEFNSRNGYQHTLTVMEIKRTHVGLFNIPTSFKSNKKYSKIGSGKVYGYEAKSIPCWEDVFAKWDNK